MTHLIDGVCSTEKEQTVASIMQQKIRRLGLTKHQASKLLQTITGCSSGSAYKWMAGSERPMRKRLPLIAKALRINVSRLEDAWIKTSVATTASHESTKTVKPKKVKPTMCTLTSMDDLEVAIELVKSGRVDNVFAIAIFFRSNFKC